MDFKDPKILIILGVVAVGGFVLLKNRGSSAGSPTPVDTSGNPTTGSTAGTGNNAIGGTYTYLDGSGVQHLIATDPNGNLTSYAADQPAFSSPSSGMLSTYSGYMGTSNGTPWLYGGSPNYALQGWESNYLAGQGLSSTSTTTGQ